MVAPIGMNGNGNGQAKTAEGGKNPFGGLFDIGTVAVTQGFYHAFEKDFKAYVDARQDLTEEGKAEIKLAFDNHKHEMLIKLTVGILAHYVKGLWRHVVEQGREPLLPDEDCRANDRAVRTGGRIMGAYEMPATKKKYWVITEADRSVTTFLLPEEY